MWPEVARERGWRSWVEVVWEGGEGWGSSGRGMRLLGPGETLRGEGPSAAVGVPVVVRELGEGLGMPGRALDGEGCVGSWGWGCCCWRGGVAGWDGGWGGWRWGVERPELMEGRWGVSSREGARGPARELEREPGAGEGGPDTWSGGRGVLWLLGTRLLDAACGRKAGRGWG